MRESNSVRSALVRGDVASLLDIHRHTYGDAVMTADPAAAAPPPPVVAPPPAAPPSPVFNPQTGDPHLFAQPATDPAGVWGTGVTPAAAPQVVPPPTQAPPAAPGQGYVDIDGVRYFNTDFVENARREERDKMHQRVESIEQMLARQAAERDAEMEAERERVTQEVAEAEQQRLAGLSSDERLQEMATRLENTVNGFNEQMARRDAIDQQERKFNELVSYRARRLGEESDLIHPTLVDLVAGPETGAASEQQIEESIAAIKAKTDAIVGTLRQDQIVQRQAMPGVAPTGAPPSAGPLDLTSGYQQVTSADIAAMDPASYAKNRLALLAAMRQSIAERGLYG